MRRPDRRAVLQSACFQQLFQGDNPLTVCARIQESRDEKGHHFEPIGYVNSCFPGRCGAPRQGILAPSTRARIELSRHIPPASLEGLSDYSHLWVIFVFDENTNACSEKGTKKEARTFPAKVAPPQLLGKRTGLFSTRTPHRPCAIGLTVVRIVSVDQRTRTVTIAGVDLVHDTPVLDIKPYIPAYDSLPTAACASWVREGGAPTLAVALSDHAAAQAADMAQSGLPASSLFANMEELLAALREVLQLDIRSTHQGRGTDSSATATPYETHFDCLLVRFRTHQGTVEVVDLQPHDVKKARHRGGPAISAASKQAESAGDDDGNAGEDDDGTRGVEEEAHAKEESADGRAQDARGKVKGPSKRARTKGERKGASGASASN
jgi:tRNA-Thr(GGU) m(6)t(6)A37 methyltransferase TsaA